mgnify:CR=1 FL=1
MIDKKKLLNLKIMLVDCDGCLTDGSLYYTEDGKYIKKFNSKDGIGLMQVCEIGIKTGIITGDSFSKIAEKRAEHLKLDFAFSGVKIKHKRIEKLLKELDLDWDNLAYFGDDLNDLETIKRSAVSFCPNDAHKTIKKHVSLVCEKAGGNGSVREACDIITNNSYFGDFSE